MKSCAEPFHPSRNSQWFVFSISLIFSCVNIGIACPLIFWCSFLESCDWGSVREKIIIIKCPWRLGKKYGLPDGYCLRKSRFSAIHASNRAVSARPYTCRYEWYLRHIIWSPAAPKRARLPFVSPDMAHSSRAGKWIDKLGSPLQMCPPEVALF